MLITLYRRLRNLDTVADLRHQLASLSARIDLGQRNHEHTTYRNHQLEGRNRELIRANLTQAQMIESLQAQLTVCRAMLAVSMRDRDAAEDRALRLEWALDRTFTRMWQMRRQRCRETAQVRLWMTRAGACRVNEN